jgi:uncharacterized protein YyaL (SSP411 family)
LGGGPANSGQPLRHRDDRDKAEPSPNSVAVSNLVRLANLADNDAWRNREAEQRFALYSKLLSEMPVVFPSIMAALYLSTSTRRSTW